MRVLLQPQFTGIKACVLPTNNESALSFQSTNHPLHYYIGIWLRTIKLRVKSSTYQKYERIARNHIIPVFGEDDPTQISAEKIFNFPYMLMDEKKLSIKTVKDIMVVFRTIFNFMQTEFGIPVPPAFSRIHIREPKRQVNVLSNDQHYLLLEYLKNETDDVKLAMLFALTMGMRLGEIVGLKWKDVDFRSNVLYISRTVQRLPNPDAASSKKTILVEETPKTPSSIRVLPLPKLIIQALQGFDRNQPDNYVIGGKQECMDTRKIQRWSKKYFLACGIEDLTFHSLRHSYATKCLELGFDEKTLSLLLGHSSVNVTLSRYVHPSLDVKRKYVSKLEDAGLG